MPCCLDPAATPAELPTPVIYSLTHLWYPLPHLPDAEPGGKSLWLQPGSRTIYKLGALLELLAGELWPLSYKHVLLLEMTVSQGRSTGTSLCGWGGVGVARCLLLSPTQD